MKLLEIRNNLIKIEYADSETPVLGKFVALAANDKSYVAQIINIKSDSVSSFIIAKLLFTFSQDGIVDNYDGSIPNLNSDVSFLPSSELLDLLPVESPIKIGYLTQEVSELILDASIFERNFTVFCDHDYEQETFISNCVRQLFWLKEKSVIVDNCNIFEDYKKLKLGEDFKLPMNSEMMDFIFDCELSEVDASTKAVIQDIFYAVGQYIKTLENGFLSIDSFIDVVSAQYKETQMPELALLKNKLLKYKDANIFANTSDEFLVLEDKLNERNCSIIDVKDFSGDLQKSVISFVHKVLSGFEKYVYLFLPLNDDNSDKKLVNKLINNNHVFTTILVNHAYKYVSELKEHADNIMFFSPQTMQHDFVSYNTFLNKLNPGEAVLYGRLTQGIPFMVDISEIETDLTQEDVFGEKQKFIPTIEEQDVEKELNVGISEKVPDIDSEDEVYDETLQESMTEYIVEDSKPETEVIETIEEDDTVEDIKQNSSIIEPIENIMDEDEREDVLSDEFTDQENENSEDDIFDDIADYDNSELTEDDLNYIDSNQEEYNIEGADLENIIEDTSFEENEGLQTVPVYPSDEGLGQNENGEENIIDFGKGDSVSHPRYGNGVVEKIIKYGNKTLCSIMFDNVGRRLLDPSVSELERV